MTEHLHPNDPDNDASPSQVALLDELAEEVAQGEINEGSSWVDEFLQKFAPGGQVAWTEGKFDDKLFPEYLDWRRTSDAFWAKVFLLRDDREL